MDPAVRGGLAAAAALALIYAAGLLTAVSYPPDALSSMIVRSAPGDLATASIETLGHWALRLVVIGTHVGVIAVGALTAKLLDRLNSFRRRAEASLVVAGVLFVSASLIGFLSGTGIGLAAFVAYGAASLVFSRIAAGRPLTDILVADMRADETPLDAIQRSRRTFAFRMAAILGGLLVGGAGALRLFGRGLSVDVELAAADVKFDPPKGDPGFPQVRGLTPEITPNESFYTVDINYIKPRVDHDSWQLFVGGDARQPYTLTYRELQERFEVVEMPHTLTCISNEVGGDLISTTVWRGVRLADILEHAELDPDVVDVVFHAADGYSDSISIEKATEATTLIAFGMNGVALPRDHGFPARVIAPNIYGMKNVKWLTRIEASRTDHVGYWQERGWSDVAIVKTHSRIDVPKKEATVTADGVLVGGVAWAGDRGIQKVEVSQDDGRSWVPAILKREISERVWRLWVTKLEPRGDTIELLVRATDGTGGIQRGRKVAAHPDGAEGYHRVSVSLRR